MDFIIWFSLLGVANLFVSFIVKEYSLKIIHFLVGILCLMAMFKELF